VSHLDDAAALFARMSLQEQHEALGALGLPKKSPKEPQEPPQGHPVLCFGQHAQQAEAAATHREGREWP
jgi:hypothetical protein